MDSYRKYLCSKFLPEVLQEGTEGSPTNNDLERALQRVSMLASIENNLPKRASLEIDMRSLAYMIASPMDRAKMTEEARERRIEAIQRAENRRRKQLEMEKCNCDEVS